MHDPLRILDILRTRFRNIHDERTELVELGARALRGQLDSWCDGNKKEEGSVSQDIKNNGTLPFQSQTLFGSSGA